MRSSGVLTARGLTYSLGRSARPMSTQGGTGILMMNMGGPPTLDKVEPFLRNLFQDGEIIPLGPFQEPLGGFIAKRRAPKIAEQYKQIGGGSPIGHWTQVQGQGMVERLDKLSPETAPHRFYTAFRYADPDTEEALTQMKRDGVERAIAFSQYPQFSCTTTGSSLNHLWRELRRLGLGDAFKWSVIDRWFRHPKFLEAVAENILSGLEVYPPDLRDQVSIVFSAHSLPMKVVGRGDQYAWEVASTVHAVMDRLNISNRYMVAWQSKVGFLPWLTPSTSDCIKGFAKQGHKQLMLVPIAFTSDHIETLFEIDIEYAEEAEEAGIEQFSRAPSLNGSELFQDALADIALTHMQSGELCTPQYRLNCAGCTNKTCRLIMNPIESPSGAAYTRHYDEVNCVPTPSSVADLP